MKRSIDDASSDMMHDDVDDEIPPLEIFGHVEQKNEPTSKKKKIETAKCVKFLVSGVKFEVEPEVFVDSDICEFEGYPLTFEKLDMENKKHNLVSYYKYEQEVMNVTSLLLGSERTVESNPETQESFFRNILTTDVQMDMTSDGYIILNRDPIVFRFIISLYRSGLDIRFFENSLRNLNVFELMTLKTELDFYMILPLARDRIVQLIEGHEVNSTTYKQIEEIKAFRFKNGTFYSLKDREALPRFKFKFPALHCVERKDGKFTGSKTFRNFIWERTEYPKLVIANRFRSIDKSRRAPRRLISDGIDVTRIFSGGNWTYDFGLMNKTGDSAIMITIIFSDPIKSNGEYFLPTVKIIAFNGDQSSLWTEPSYTCIMDGSVFRMKAGDEYIDAALIFYNYTTSSIEMMGFNLKLEPVLDGLYLDPNDEWYLCDSLHLGDKVEPHTEMVTKSLISDLLIKSKPLLDVDFMLDYFKKNEWAGDNDSQRKEIFDSIMATHVSDLIVKSRIIPETPHDWCILCTAAIRQNTQLREDDPTYHEKVKNTTPKSVEGKKSKIPNVLPNIQGYLKYVVDSPSPKLKNYQEFKDTAVNLQNMLTQSTWTPPTPSVTGGPSKSKKRSKDDDIFDLF